VAIALFSAFLAQSMASNVFADAAVEASTKGAPQVIRVGPRQSLTSVADAARQARDGDLVEIEAGVYLNDVASWPQSDLTIRGVGGRARMVVTGKSAEDKAIWVIEGNNVVVENVEFAGAAVPHENGAGIRHEGGRLTIRNCLFEHNQMGLLTWNSETAELVIEASEFRDNRVASTYSRGDWVGHQIYVGSIGRFTLRDSYVHRGAFGHLVKTRARENRIYYNRLTDEAGGRASYELELPNGGIAYVVGNIIEQSASTENRIVVAYGAEGYRWPDNRLYLVNNTLVDHVPREGTFLRVWPGAGYVVALNNLLVGGTALESTTPGKYAGNVNAGPRDVALLHGPDYRILRTSRLVGTAIDPGEANGISLRVDREYVHPMQSRPVARVPFSPGALQGLAP
jgi:hypothetical protein